MKQWKRDVILSCTMLAISLYALIYSIEIKDNKMKYFMARADVYVTLWTSLLAILSILLLIRTLKNKPEGTTTPIFTRQFLISAAIILLYVFLLTRLGFVLSSILFLLALLVYYTYEENGRTLPKGKALVKQIIIWIVIAGLSVVLTQFLFGNVLGLNLPKGIFRN